MAKPKPTEERFPVSLSLNRDLYTKLRVIAFMDNTSKQAIIEAALSQFIEHRSATVEESRLAVERLMVAQDLGIVNCPAPSSGVAITSENGD